MDIPIYQVDAFASEAFKGNPAAVCPLQSWLPDATLQAIAMENNLSETAFLVPHGADYHLRWFTPAAEVDLCGHATLGSAHVVAQHLKPGADVIIPTSVTDEQAKEKFPKGWKAVKPYLRVTPPPG